MSDQFRFDDAFYAVPPAAVDADPAGKIRELLYRVSKLEHAVEEERLQAIADARERYLEIISLHDDITTVVERWGITTKAQEAAIAGAVVALAKKLTTILRRHQVEALNTVGETFSAETSDVVGSELHDDMPANMVLRDVQVGYTWPHGLLRRAKVIVSARPVAAEPAPAEGATPQVVPPVESVPTQPATAGPAESLQDSTLIAPGDAQ
jgi:hypothetical protein